VYVLGAALLWSLGGVFTKSLALDGLTIAFYRGLFGGLVLLPVVPRARWVVRPAMLPLGLCFGAMTGFYIGAIKATTAANAIYLQCTSTFWTIPLSAWLLGERPDRRSVWAIGIATVGIAAIVLYGYDGRPREEIGIALGLASGLTYAGVAIGLRGLRDLDPIWLSAINNLMGALALGTWILLYRGAIAVPTGGQALTLLGFGALQMAIPYCLFARGLRALSAPEAGLLALLEPALNPIWVVLFHGERPAPATLAGGLFLLSGVAIRYAPIPHRWPEVRRFLRLSGRRLPPR
jgi:drug/metabolite transporter (DMT)-like permease